MADLTDILSINSGPLAGLKNAFINGNFDFWQRGTSFTASGYAADRFRFNLGTTAAATISRQAFTIGQTDVPGNPSYYYRNNTTTAATAFHLVIEQRLEGVETLAGETVTFSFWAKAGAAKTLIADFSQFFGTGGTPSATVDGANQNVVLTTSWQKFSFQFDLPSVSTKVLGTSGEDHVSFRIAEVGSFSLFTVDIARMQLERGTVATEFEERPISLELALCQRYYWKTFPQDTTPASSAGIAGSITYRTGTTGIVASGQYVQFPVKMRAAPTITFYNSEAAGTTWRNTTDVGNSGASSTSSIGDEGFFASNAQVATDAPGELLSIHATAASEI